MFGKTVLRDVIYEFISVKTLKLRLFVLCFSYFCK